MSSGSDVIFFSDGKNNIKTLRKPLKGKFRAYSIGLRKKVTK